MWMSTRVPPNGREHIMEHAEFSVAAAGKQIRGLLRVVTCVRLAFDAGIQSCLPCGDGHDKRQMREETLSLLGRRWLGGVLRARVCCVRSCRCETDLGWRSAYG